MSALRKFLTRPETYLVLLVVVIGLVLADSYQAPANQVTSHVYVAGVHAYQAVGRPLLKNRIRCRYEPTCSVYSIEAVQRFGIRRGLEMTARRLNTCRADVPLGTNDPVPEAFE
ncbi:MAG TPA: membrane protein insertion efficiency factor YidD [Gemmatimonadota bacterium]|nr:membrane protein insertion efficiency factor YidD [Gemmatimonadota bacterium]